LRRHQQLTGLAASLRVVEAAEGKDISDHLAAGHTVEELVLADPWAPMADHDEMPDGAGVISDRPAWRSALIDWTAFWARDRQDLDWLVEPFIARGRAHALAAPAKTGKSLLTLEAVAALATGRSVLAQPAGDPVDVVYVDFEMTEDDLHERLTDLGYGTDDDLSHLHYHLLPSLPPLDTDAGGWVLEQMAGDHHAKLLVIDTIGRAVDGPENDAETFLAFTATPAPGSSGSASPRSGSTTTARTATAASVGARPRTTTSMSSGSSPRATAAVSGCAPPTNGWRGCPRSCRCNAAATRCVTDLSRIPGPPGPPRPSRCSTS
jgi:hypothetical protein